MASIEISPLGAMPEWFSIIFNLVSVDISLFDSIFFKSSTLMFFISLYGSVVTPKSSLSLSVYSIGFPLVLETFILPTIPIGRLPPLMARSINPDSTMSSCVIALSSSAAGIAANSVLSVAKSNPPTAPVTAFFAACLFSPLLNTSPADENIGDTNPVAVPIKTPSPQASKVLLQS